MTLQLDNYTQDYSDIVNQSVLELSSFFEFKLNTNPCLILVNSRQQFDELVGYKSPLWLTGLSVSNIVFFLNPDKWASESNKQYLPEKLKQTIKHEISHQYYRQVAWKNIPKWLFEGVALYLGDQLNSHPKNTNFDNFLKFETQLEIDGLSVYQESGNVIKRLVDNFSKEKLLKLIASTRNINNSQDFLVSFKKIYGFELNYENINNL